MRGGGSRACQGHAEGGMRNRGEDAAAGSKDNLMYHQWLTKNLPLKAEGREEIPL